MRLIDREAGEEFLVPERVERDRGDPHRRAVSRPFFVGGRFKPSFFDVLLDSPTAGGPHVGGIPRQPFGKPVRYRPEIPPFRPDDTPGDAKRHFRVVGDLPGDNFNQPPPTISRRTPYRLRISDGAMNSVVAPSASPTATPKSAARPRSTIPVTSRGVPLGGAQ